MNMTDPVADLLTRIRNANKVGFEAVTIPYSKLKEGIVKVLQEEGFVRSYETAGMGFKKNLVVELKYTAKKERVIGSIVRVSKPAKRVYVGYNDVKPVRSGMGIAILSTPKGIMTDASARQKKLGGEWLCSVW